MDRLFEVKQAEELLDAAFIAKWQDRQSLDPFDRKVLQAVWERFITAGDPVGVETVVELLAWHDPAEVYEAIARLDEKDLIVVREGRQPS